MVMFKFNTPTKYLETLDPYDYLSFVWANAAASGDAYRLPFENCMASVIILVVIREV